MKTIIICMISLFTNVIYSQACISVTLELKLDNYPNETTWQVLNSTNQVVANGGSYSGQNNQLKTIAVCLVSGQNYTFKIFDSYGDGICCSYGQGYYKLTYNGQTLFNGGQFTQNATHSFCFNCSGGAPTPTCNDGIQNGTETGIDCGGSCAPCGTNSGCTNITLNIRTDNYPSETTWQLRNAAGTLLHSGGPYNQSNTLSSISLCLVPGQYYTFRIIDSYGDGICCAHGQGYYSITLTGNTLIQGGAFGSTEEKSFCLQCTGGTQQSCYDGIQNGNETGIDCGGSCQPCNTLPKRNIVFVHGLSGSASSWTQMNQIHNINFNGNITNWQNRRMDSRAITYNQTNLLNASNSAASLISFEMNIMRATNTVPVINNDIVIAHSMGGLVMRDVDRRFTFNNIGTKPYGGIITFGTPHTGSPAASNLFNGNLTSFISNTCTPLAQGPLREALTILFPISSVTGIFAVNNTGTELADQICNGFILNRALALLSQFPGLANDARVEIVNSNPPYSAPNVRKIAAYGIEQEPVLWRYARSMQANANSFPPFGADQDGELISYVQDVINFTNIRISTSLLNPWLRNGWMKTRNTIQDLNTNYKALISNPINTFTFTGQCKVDAYLNGSLNSTTYYSVSNPDLCDQYNEVIGCCFERISIPQFNVTGSSIEASDAFIPISSQMAFPGATTLQMPGSNHEQMKNDSNTKIVLNRIYNANDGFIDGWWAIETR